MHDLALFSPYRDSSLKSEVLRTLLMKALTDRKFPRYVNVMKAYVLRKKIYGGRGKVATDLRLLALKEQNKGFAWLYLL